MRARLALAVSGVPYELREVVLKNKPAELITASPKGTVPVLVLPSGQVIDESLSIMHWALEQHDPDGWLTHDVSAEADTFIAANDGPFKHALDRYKYPNRYPQRSGTDTKTFAAAQRHEAARWLQSLESQLKGGWLFGQQASFADIAILPFVRQFAHTDATWFAEQPWPQLQVWLDKFEASALFEGVMGKHAPWKTAACIGGGLTSSLLLI